MPTLDHDEPRHHSRASTGAPVHAARLDAWMLGLDAV
jgi:hypothetical protein